MPVRVLTPNDGEEDYPLADRWAVDGSGNLHLTEQGHAPHDTRQIATYARGEWVSVADGDDQPSATVSMEFAADIFDQHPDQCVAALEAEVIAPGLNPEGDVQVTRFWRNSNWLVRLSVRAVPA